MRGIHLEEVPAWYDLRPIPKGFIIEIHPQALTGFLQGLQKFSYLYTKIMSREGPVVDLPKFQMPGERQIWGYVPCLTQQKPRNKGWTAYVCRFPQHHPGNPNDLVLCSATLRNIFDALNFESIVTDWKKPQLLNVTTVMTQLGIDGSFLSAEVSTRLAHWFGGITEDKVLAVRRAMRQTWNWIQPKWQENIADFRVNWLDPESIHLDVPGNATGLDPDINHEMGTGYTLTGHNVDGPGQQFSLLAGLAKLNQLARDDGL